MTVTSALLQFRHKPSRTHKPVTTNVPGPTFSASVAHQYSTRVLLGRELWGCAQ